MNRNQIVIATDKRSSIRLLLIGVNARDRPGLLLDISKCLFRLNLQLHCTEAAVLDERSVSVWRCTYMENIDPDAGEISAVLSVSLVTLHFTHQAFKD
jgi:UTP:GlnB (protein PII) uridylyltransferase